MKRYVILKHVCPPDYPRGDHYDLMLEEGDHLKTWVVPEPPRPDLDVIVELLPDHRLEFLEYEGPLSGNRGYVERWDQGTYCLENQNAGSMTVTLQSERVAVRIIVDALEHQPRRFRFRCLPA